MLPRLIRRKTLARDFVLSGVALAVVLVVIAVALSTVWLPARPIGYVCAAILAAGAVPLSRLAPRATLLVVAVVMTLPWFWVFIESEVRIVPLCIVAFRAAQFGATKWFVIPVVALATPLVIEPHMLQHLQISEALAEWRQGVAWYHPSVDIMQGIVVAVIVALGYAAHRQQQVAEDLNRQNAELIALRGSERDRIAVEVQTAIARDIHDVVAHHVAAMVVTAQAADRVADRDPERLRTTVRAIAAEGDEALTAMRRVVQVLRSTPIPSRESESFDSEMRKLTARLTSSGRPVTVTGEVSGTTEFVESTVLRIVQESLTNVMLHSDGNHISVRFTTTDDDVEVLVEDDGRPGAVRNMPRGGNGIIGMRERARAVGGTVSAGPRSEGGWAVKAVLPRAGHPVLR